MKKLLLLAIALTSGTIFAQGGASANASARINAEIVSPISISSIGTLDFGRIAATAEGGEVYISPEGTRSAKGENLLIPGAVSTAKFKVKAADGYAYNLAVKADPLSTSANSGAHTMNVAFELANDKFTGNGQEQLIGLNSTLTVNPAQPAGEYSGEVTMTVAYE